MATPLPQQPAPALDLPFVVGGRFHLADQQPERYTMLVFYRGLHCPQCKKQLQQMRDLMPELARVGVNRYVAISGDDHDRAQRTREDWELADLPVAYGLTPDDMKRWGLYVSKGIKEGEPGLFCEPALYLVRPDGTIYSAHVQSMPFARPHLEDVVKGLEWINENDYPPRGEAA